MLVAVFLFGAEMNVLSKECSSEKSLAIRPNNINAHNNIALAYYSQGKYKLALAHFDRVISLGGQVNQQLVEFLESYR